MRCAALLVALLLAVAGVAGPAGAAQSAPEIGPPETTFHVHLQPDGDARWVVRMTFTLETESERDAFREYAERFEAGETTGGPSVEFFEAAAAGAQEVTGREMSIRKVARSSSVSTGTLELSFVWTNFLGTEGSKYVLADALATPNGGTWLESLEKGQRLVLHTPDGYEIDRSVEAAQQNDSLVIVGPESYRNGESGERFVVVYSEAEPESPTTSTGTTPPGPPAWGVVAGGVALLVLAAVAAVWLWQRRADDASAGTTGDDDTPDAPPAGATVDEPATGDGGETVAETGPDGESDVDLTLLSDEERVEHLLERNGGRMRQADIVSETDWSDAKVSQLLSRMADEGRVEKLRLGRENLISLPDAEADEE